MARNKGTAKSEGKTNGKSVKGEKSNAITLAQICKECKMEPRAARRRLRNSGITVDGGRWEWTSRKDADRAKKVLQSAAE